MGDCAMKAREGYWQTRNTIEMGVFCIGFMIAAALGGILPSHWGGFTQFVLTVAWYWFGIGKIEKSIAEQTAEQVAADEAWLQEHRDE
jgi:hypothetical protein